MSKKTWRMRRIVRPGLQMHLTLTFLGLAALSLVFQYILFTKVITAAIAELDLEQARAFEEISAGMMTAAFFSLGVVLPLTLVVGVLVTFKIAGPIHRFESWLTDLAEGRVHDECRIRKGDQLQDFCALLNRATRPLWEAQAPEHSGEEGAAEGHRGEHSEEQAA